MANFCEEPREQAKASLTLIIDAGFNSGVSFSGLMVIDKRGHPASDAKHTIWWCFGDAVRTRKDGLTLRFA